MPDDILDLAHGDARLAAKINSMLQTIAEGESETLSEMARGVLDGSPLRESALSSAYGYDLGVAFGTFWNKYQSMSDSERADLEAKGRDQQDD